MSGEILNNVTVCFTGHRTIKTDGISDVIEKLDIVIERCISKGYKCFLSGGALGFDTLAAHCVIKAREKHPDVKLLLILPCRDQTKLWKSLPDINEYRYLKESADDIIYIQDFYDAKCMMKRNIYMVENSSLCISYFDGRAGGTSNTINYAKENGVAVINLFTGHRR